MNYEPQFAPVYDRIVQAAQTMPRYILSEGGTRSGKTFAALQFLWFLIGKDKTPTINSVVSETMPHLKRGAIRDFQNILGVTWNEECWNKSESIYIHPNSGSRLEFFSADAPAKVHGPARKRLFINECNHIDWDTARQLFVRTSGLIMLDYNPTHLFWANEIIETRENCAKVHSTYKDNPFLSDEQIREIESNKDDANWWRVYGEGKVGVLEGLIFPEFEQVDDMPQVLSDGMIESYGMDFGFTHDPSTLVRCITDNRKRELWFDELMYQTGMLNSDMAAVMKQNNIPRNKPIYGDAAEPKTIEDIKRYGFNMLPCYKATRVAEQLQMMKGYKWKVTKRSLNLIRELRGYVWQRDKDGNWLNEPIGINDHAIAGCRYGVFLNLRLAGRSHSGISVTRY
jgi:phage terminase large subunit